MMTKTMIQKARPAINMETAERVFVKQVPDALGALRSGRQIPRTSRNLLKEAAQYDGGKIVLQRDGLTVATLYAASSEAVVHGDSKSIARSDAGRSSSGAVRHAHREVIVPVDVVLAALEHGMKALTVKTSNRAYSMGLGEFVRSARIVGTNLALDVRAWAQHIR